MPDLCEGELHIEIHQGINGTFVYPCRVGSVPDARKHLETAGVENECILDTTSRRFDM